MREPPLRIRNGTPDFAVLNPGFLLAATARLPRVAALAEQARMRERER